MISHCYYMYPPQPYYAVSWDNWPPMPHLFHTFPHTQNKESTHLFPRYSTPTCHPSPEGIREVQSRLEEVQLYCRLQKSWCGAFVHHPVFWSSHRENWVWTFFMYIQWAKKPSHKRSNFTCQANCCSINKGIPVGNKQWCSEIGVHPTHWYWGWVTSNMALAPPNC